MVNAKEFEHLEIISLHPTFVAEVRGVDFSKPVPQEVCDEIADAAHKYAVLVFKKTGLDDERHISFAKNFGELDSVLQFMKPGAKTRLAPYYDLWDAGNLDADGNIIPGHTRQYEYNKVF
jgi:alpha-ketoglutarate-dependent 2,4-dichlorophenoxyacetate dioxygenase